MKKIVFALIILFVIINIAAAKEYESSYGFSINVPEHWLVLTPKEIKENPDLFNFENVDFGNIDKNLIKQVISRVKNGSTEIFFNQNTADFTFTDNINIIKQIGKFPTKNSEVEKYCNQLDAQLSKYAGRKLDIYHCKPSAINNMKVFFNEFDGMMNGTRSLQYSFQKSPSVVIIITCTSKNETLDIIRQEFNDMMSTIKF